MTNTMNTMIIIGVEENMIWMLMGIVMINILTVIVMMEWKKMITGDYGHKTNQARQIEQLLSLPVLLV